MWSCGIHWRWDAQDISPLYKLENYSFKITVASPKLTKVTHIISWLVYMKDWTTAYGFCSKDTFRVNRKNTSITAHKSEANQRTRNFKYVLITNYNTKMSTRKQITVENCVVSSITMNNIIDIIRVCCFRADVINVVHNFVMMVL